MQMLLLRCLEAGGGVDGRVQELLCLGASDLPGGRVCLGHWE